MPNLLVKASSKTDYGTVVEVTPESANWKYIGFAVKRIAKGHIHKEECEFDRETCIVVLSGILNAKINQDFFENIGKRMSVFERVPPYCIFAPAGAAIEITANSDVEIAICNAPASTKRNTRIIEPDEIQCEERGVGTNTRFVNALLAGEGEADSLILFEVFTPSGHWSSYPPHKHDEDNLPNESALEEVYYHKIFPPQGFAFQRVYTDDREIDETVSVEDGDTVLVPRGYHPVGAPPGYDLYYLNVMAGPVRKWIFNNDPDHEWIMHQPK